MIAQPRLEVTRLRRGLGDDVAVEPEGRDVDRQWIVAFLVAANTG